MKIPNDIGGSWRYNKLVEYIGSFPDEIGPLARDFLKNRKATKSDVVWWVLLYSACYCMGTACILFDSLNYKTVTEEELEEFWEENKPRLIFQSDRRYIKNMNQFCHIAKEFIQRSHRRPWKYISQFIHEDPVKTYTALYKEVSSWRYYGRFGTILFLYNLNKLMGIDMHSESYDWKHGATTTSAIYNAEYKDSAAARFEDDSNITKEEEKRLDGVLGQIIKDLKKRYPNKRWTIMGVTSDLCSYRKLFKQTRYLGYYVDRQQEELMWLESRWPELESTWTRFWECRKKYLNNEFLGEVKGWEGIQKSLMTSWVDRGEFR